MKDKLIKAMQSKTFWMAFISLVTGVCIQLGLITFGQQFNAIMALVIPFMITIGIVHDNEPKDKLKESDVEKGMVE